MMNAKAIVCAVDYAMSDYMSAKYLPTTDTTYLVPGNEVNEDIPHELIIAQFGSSVALPVVGVEQAAE